MDIIELVAQVALELSEHMETEYPECAIEVKGDQEEVGLHFVAAPEMLMERRLYDRDPTPTQYFADIQQYVEEITAERREQLNFRIVFSAVPLLTRRGV